jgi:hypothetical protein
VEVRLVVSELNLKISVLGQAGYQYVLEYQENLNETAWIPLTQPIPGAGSLLDFNDTIQSSGSRFYRIRVVKAQ